jgi:hypothetical protein
MPELHGDILFPLGESGGCHFYGNLGVGTAAVIQ